MSEAAGVRRAGGTAGSMLASGTALLAPVSDSPHTDASRLLAHVLECDRSWIVAHGDALLSPAHRVRFERLCALRAAGMPLAYVLGSTGFYGREFAVNERVLVPRPETEHLVDEALAFAADRGASNEPLAVLDVGTGSGAIAVTLAAENARIVVDATDASFDALAVARANADAHGVSARCRFHLGNLAEPVAGRRFDLVLANLPYVRSARIPPKPDPLAFEPRMALDGGVDGLDLYRALLPELPRLLAPGGMALLEGSQEHMRLLEGAVVRALPGARVAVAPDYAGRDRYLRVATAAA